MNWTADKPVTPGYYWYRRIEKAMPGISSRPRIIYVNTNLCVPQFNLWEYKEPVSVKEYKGEWCGPIPEPEEDLDFQINEDTPARMTDLH